MNGLMLRGPTPPAWWALALLVLVLPAVGSCGPDFDPYWKVNKFRLLAIKADPVTLRPGETSTLSAATYDPGHDPISYRWEWCPFRVSSQNRYECPVTVDQINEMIAEQAPEGEQVPPLPDDFFELGDEPTVAFAYPGSQQMILGFCEAIVESIAQAGQDSPLGSQLSVLDCSKGFEVSVRLVTTTSDDEIIARKRVLLTTTPGTQVNLNPDVTGMSIRLEKSGDFHKLSDTLEWVGELGEPAGATEERDWYVLPSDDPLPVVANIPFNITAEVDPLSVESWRPPAPEGSDEELLPHEPEVFDFRWFASAGDLSDTRGLFVDGRNTLQSAGKANFNVPYDSSVADFDEDGVSNGSDNCAPLYNPDQRDSNGDGLGDGCDVYFWTVVRDGRLGLDYVERHVRVVRWD